MNIRPTANLAIRVGGRQRIAAGDVLRTLTTRAKAAQTALRPVRDDLSRAWERRYLGFVRARR